MQMSTSFSMVPTVILEIYLHPSIGVGTDAEVSIELFGENGKSGTHDNAQDNFERNTFIYQIYLQFDKLLKKCYF